jgi:hypothetical protein
MPKAILICIGFSILVLAGCSAPTIEERNSANSPSTGERAGQVVNRPLSDLNLSQTAIPPLLVQASLAPYAPAADPSCAGMQKESNALTQILGPDIRPAKQDKNGGFISEQDAGETAWNTADGLADSWIPFHGVLRALTGAQQHEQMVDHAILAGFVRRAYLEGMQASRLCQ